MNGGDVKEPFGSGGSETRIANVSTMFVSLVDVKHQIYGSKNKIGSSIAVVDIGQGTQGCCFRAAQLSRSHSDVVGFHLRASIGPVKLCCFEVPKTLIHPASLNILKSECHIVYVHKDTTPDVILHLKDSYCTPVC